MIASASTELPRLTRKSMLRLTPKQYEVFRPGPNTLEQFTLKSEVWTSLLTKTMSAQVQTLEKHFRIVGSEAKGAPAKARRIFFEPRTKKLAKKIAKLEVVIDTKRYVLERVAFTEKGGDSVSFELSNHRLNKGVAPKMFKVPKNPKTRVIRHEAGK